MKAYMRLSFQVISKCMNALQMDSVNVMVLSKDFESRNICKEIEPWFQTRYEATGKTSK